MSDTQMIKKLMNEVQMLRDELAVMKRKYEDIIYNLDTDNFSSKFVKEQGDMRTAINVTAESVESKVSKEDFKSAITQTAESISSIVSEFVDVSQAEEVDSPDEFADTSKIYVIRDGDNETFYHFNTISQDWKEISANGIIYSLFEQKGDGFYLKGDVKVQGSCILTDSLTFDSSDNPLQVEYSVNGTSGWHGTFASGSDKFMRIKIGASWSGAMKIVGDDGQAGEGADVNDETIFELLTDGGTTQGLFPVFYNSGNKLYINASYIKSGTIEADRIDTKNLSCTKLYSTDVNGCFVKINGKCGDLGIYNKTATGNNAKESNCIWGIYPDGQGRVDFYIYGFNYMAQVLTDNGYSHKIKCYGDWDFSGANVDFGDNFIANVAVFGNG